MRVFILEDDANRMAGFLAVLHGADVTHAIGVTEAREHWKPPYDLILLDHDLGGEVYVPSGEDNTGAGFLRTPQVFDGLRGTDPIIVHSWNPQGAEEMIRLIRDAGFSPHYMPFGVQLLTAIQNFHKGVSR